MHFFSLKFSTLWHSQTWQYFVACTPLNELLLVAPTLCQPAVFTMVHLCIWGPLSRLQAHFPKPGFLNDQSHKLPKLSNYQVTKNSQTNTLNQVWKSHPGHFATGIWQRLAKVQCRLCCPVLWGLSIFRIKASFIFWIWGSVHESRFM